MTWRLRKDEVGFRLDGGEVLVGPRLVIAARERLPVIDGKRQTQGTSRSRRKLQARERVAAAGDDRHHGPVAAPEHAGERFLIDGTRLGRLARMGVNPDPAKLLGTQPAINLLIKELGD